MPFSKLGLSAPVVEGVKAMGYVDPTPIQLRAIPMIMSGQDVIGFANSGGTGENYSLCHKPFFGEINEADCHPCS